MKKLNYIHKIYLWLVAEAMHEPWGISPYGYVWGTLVFKRGLYTHSRLIRQLLEASFIHPPVCPFLREFFCHLLPTKVFLDPSHHFWPVLTPTVPPTVPHAPYPLWTLTVNWVRNQPRNGPRSRKMFIHEINSDQWLADKDMGVT